MKNENQIIHHQQIVLFFSGGNYIYEREFNVPNEWKEKVVRFEFEGVYRKAEVYINDKLAGKCSYGYIPFWIETNNLLKYGTTNKIQVKVNNNEQPNCRWYSGSGIYRPVWIWVQDMIHIEPEGVKISTLSYDPTEIQISTIHTGGQISIEILDPSKKTVIATADGDEVKLQIPNAKLWSSESPNLYVCRAILKNELGEQIETRTLKFGVRLIKVTKEGLIVNGESTLLRGGCVHHDNGILGARTFAKAERRRVRILKEAGFNAIRSSHNPASSAMVEACDELGVYLMDETWDMWYGAKLAHDYSEDFERCFRDDVRTIVRRDFSHASVIFYSIGNEVSEPHEEKGLKIEKEIIDLFHQLDPTRPVTCGFNIMIVYLASIGRGIYQSNQNNQNGSGNNGEGNNGGGSIEQNAPVVNTSEQFNMMAQMVGQKMNMAGCQPEADKASSPGIDMLDIAGYNYASGRVVVGSETFSFDIARNWMLVESLPHLVGDFMWTAWDYIGETGAGAWCYSDDGRGFGKPYPWLLADVGAIDIIGTPNAELGYARVVWRQLAAPYIGVQPPNHPGAEPYKAIWRGTNALPSWSWRGCDGNEAKVEVYMADHSVKLFLNGKMVGEQKVEEQRSLFTIKYEPGILEAASFDTNGKETGRASLRSANDAEVQIAVIPEDIEIPLGEICFVKVNLQDKNGVVESNADVKVAVRVECGELLAFGSANPRTEERFGDGAYTTYYGRAMAVVKGTKKGVIRVIAEDETGRNGTGEVKVV